MATPSGRRGSIPLLGTLVAGLVLGGVTSALGFWVLSGLAQPLPAELRLGLVIAVAVAALADDALGRGWRWPQNARQVPQAVRHREPRLALLQFGFELGTGVRTFVTSRAPYIVVAVFVAGGLSLPQALVAGAGFGLGRALMPVTRGWHGSAADWDQRLERTSRLVKVAATLLVGCAAVWTTIVALW